MKSDADTKPPEDAANVLECAICLQSIESEGPHVAAALACGHCLGWSCLNEYFARSAKKCPLCQKAAKSSQIRKLYLPAFGVKPSEHEVDNLKRQLEDKDDEIRKLKRVISLKTKVKVNCRIYEVNGKLGKNVYSFTGHWVYSINSAVYVWIVSSKRCELLGDGVGEFLGTSGELIAGSQRMFHVGTGNHVEYTDGVEFKTFIGFTETSFYLIGVDGSVGVVDSSGVYTRIPLPTTLPVTAAVVAGDDLLIFTFKNLFAYNEGSGIRPFEYPSQCISVSEVNYTDEFFISTHRGPGAPFMLISSYLASPARVQVFARLEGLTLPFSTCRVAGMLTESETFLAAAPDKQGILHIWKLDSTKGPLTEPVLSDSHCTMAGRCATEVPTFCDFGETDGKVALAVVSANMLTIDLVE